MKKIDKNMLLHTHVWTVGLVDSGRVKLDTVTTVKDQIAGEEDEKKKGKSKKN